MPLDENDLKQIRDLLKGVTDTLPEMVRTTITKMADDNKKKLSAKPNPAPKPGDKDTKKADDGGDKGDKKTKLADMTTAQLERLGNVQLIQLVRDELLGEVQGIIKSQIDPLAQETSRTSARVVTREFLNKYPEAQYLQDELQELIDNGEATTLRSALAIIKSENPDAHKKALVEHQKAEGTYKDPEEIKKAEEKEAEARKQPLSLFHRPIIEDASSADDDGTKKVFDSREAAARAYDMLAQQEGIDPAALPQGGPAGD